MIRGLVIPAETLHHAEALEVEALPPVIRALARLLDDQAEEPARSTDDEGGD